MQGSMKISAMRTSVSFLTAGENRVGVGVAVGTEVTVGVTVGVQVGVARMLVGGVESCGIYH